MASEFQVGEIFLNHSMNEAGAITNLLKLEFLKISDAFFM
jgi:hypothetical protein